MVERSALLTDGTGSSPGAISRQGTVPAVEDGLSPLPPRLGRRPVGDGCSIRRPTETDLL